MKIGKHSWLIALAAISAFIIGTRAGSRREKRSLVNHNARQADSSGQNKSERAAIEPLTLDILRKRIAEMFSGGYLTLLAIIQGVALGLLLETFRGQMFALHPPDRLTLAVQALGVLVAIVIITHQYFLFTALVRWIPTTLDTLYPYALGLGEVGSALSLGNNTYWWGGVSLQLLAGGGAYAYSIRRADKPVFGDLKDLYKSFHQSVRRQAWICFALLAYSSAMVIFSIYIALPRWFNVLSACAVITAGAILIPFAHDQTKDYEDAELPVWRAKHSLDPRRHRRERSRLGRSGPAPRPGTGQD